MGQRAEELKREIAESRDHLGSTLDAIGDRVSPGRVVDRRKTRMRNRATGMRERLMGAAEVATHRLEDAASGLSGRAGEAAGSAREAVSDKARTAQQPAGGGSPLLVGALAFGAGLLMASVLPEGEAEGETAARLAGKLEPARQTLTEAGQDLAESAKEAGTEALQELKSQAETGAQQVKESAAEAAGQIKEQARSAAADVRDEASSQEQTVRTP